MIEMVSVSLELLASWAFWAIYYSEKKAGSGSPEPESANSGPTDAPSNKESRRGANSAAAFGDEEAIVCAAREPK